MFLGESREGFALPDGGTGVSPAIQLVGGRVGKRPLPEMNSRKPMVIYERHR